MSLFPCLELLTRGLCSFPVWTWLYSPEQLRSGGSYFFRRETQAVCLLLEKRWCQNTWIHWLIEGAAACSQELFCLEWKTTPPRDANFQAVMPVVSSPTEDSAKKEDLEKVLSGAKGHVEVILAFPKWQSPGVRVGDGSGPFGLLWGELLKSLCFHSHSSKTHGFNF